MVRTHLRQSPDLKACMHDDNDRTQILHALMMQPSASPRPRDAHGAPKNMLWLQLRSRDCGSSPEATEVNLLPRHHGGLQLALPGFLKDAMAGRRITDMHAFAKCSRSLEDAFSEHLAVSHSSFDSWPIGGNSLGTRELGKSQPHRKALMRQRSFNRRKVA